jgi:oxygen-independent coproporphyrinogen-3 oxidase
MQPHSIYIHIPFCRHRCGYCDFNTYAGMEERIPVYMDALDLEIRKVARSTRRTYPVHSIFFGGGTPSLIPVARLERTLVTIRDLFPLTPDLEMTLEANPGTVSLEYLRRLRQIGFNRISFGMQSARPDELRLLERQHTTFDVIDAIRWARQVGFDNLSLDLIFNLPFQTLADWQQTVETAISLHPEHLSLYALTIEEGTPLFRMRRKGLIADPDDDLAADMYDWAGQRLVEAGFEQYEISNWARRSPNGELQACRHNLQYWKDRPYFGFGAGAHGYLGELRYANARGIKGYTRMVHDHDAQFPLGPAVVETWPVDPFTAMQEMMMVGLRLVQEGVSRAEFSSRFGRQIDDVFKAEIRDLLAKKLIEEDGERIRLTHTGRFIGNRVFMQFVGD